MSTLFAFYLLPLTLLTTMFTASQPLPPAAALVTPLSEEEEMVLSEAMEGRDSLEELLDHLLDLGDKEWAAKYRPTRRPVQRPAK